LKAIFATLAAWSGLASLERFKSGFKTLLGDNGFVVEGRETGETLMGDGTDRNGECEAVCFGETSSSSSSRRCSVFAGVGGSLYLALLTLLDNQPSSKAFWTDWTN